MRPMRSKPSRATGSAVMTAASQNLRRACDQHPTSWRTGGASRSGDVRDERRRRERARQDRRRQRHRGDRRRARRVGRRGLLVDRARGHHAHQAAAAIRGPARLLPADPLGRAFEHRVDLFEPLDRQIGLREIAAPGGRALGAAPARAGPGRVVAVALVGGAVVEPEPAVERIELGELLAELQLELRGVEALALGVEQPLLEQRQLDLQVLVGEPEQVALGGELLAFDRELVALGRETMPLLGECGDRCALGRQRCFQLGDSGGGVDHGPRLRDRDRAVEPARS